VCVCDSRVRVRERRRVPMLLMSTTPTNGFFRDDPRFIAGPVAYGGEKLFHETALSRHRNGDNLDLLDEITQDRLIRLTFTFFFIFVSAKHVGIKVATNVEIQTPF